MVDKRARNAYGGILPGRRAGAPFRNPHRCAARGTPGGAGSALATARARSITRSSAFACGPFLCMPTVGRSYLRDDMRAPGGEGAGGA